MGIPWRRLFGDGERLMAGDEWRRQLRCPECKRFIYRAGQRHICRGRLARCLNPRCRRLLPYGHRGLCPSCLLAAGL